MDEDFLVLREDDPFLFLEGAIQSLVARCRKGADAWPGKIHRFYVKREVYLRTSSRPGDASCELRTHQKEPLIRQRFWRGFSGLRDMLPQA